MIKKIDTGTNGSKLDDATLYVVGDHDTICQLVQLLSYIRHSIQTKTPTNINLKIGHKVSSDFFNFDVNGVEIRDRLPQPIAEIN